MSMTVGYKPYTGAIDTSSAQFIIISVVYQNFVRKLGKVVDFV